MNYKYMTRGELLELCWQRYHSWYNHLTKAQLIKHLQEAV